MRSGVGDGAALRLKYNARNLSSERYAIEYGVPAASSRLHAPHPRDSRFACRFSKSSWLHDAIAHSISRE